MLSDDGHIARDSTSLFPLRYVAESIPGGAQTALWEQRDGRLYVSFLCPLCTVEWEDLGLVEPLEPEPARHVSFKRWP